MLPRISAAWALAAVLTACGGSGSSDEPIPVVLDGLYSLPSHTCASFDHATTEYKFWSDGSACDARSPSERPTMSGPFSFDPATGILSLVDSSNQEVYVTTLSILNTSPLDTQADPLHILDGTSLTGPGASLTTGSGGSLTKTIQLLRAEDADATPLANGQNTLTSKGQIQLLRADGI